MFIFRFEHKRDICGRSPYHAEGSSLTGHGTFTVCSTKSGTPNFGLCGSGPSRIMEHERCATTVEQFNLWIGEDYTCKGMTKYCKNEDFCMACPAPRVLHYDADSWEIIAYWVEDNARGIDWREDNKQIVFNPRFAINMGAVTVADVEAFAKELV